LLSLLAERCKNLRELGVQIIDAPDVATVRALVFPKRVRKLHADLPFALVGGDAEQTPDAQQRWPELMSEMVAVIAQQLPDIEELHLGDVPPGISLAPLRSLTNLRVFGCHWKYDEFDASCVDELRNSLPSQLEYVDVDIPGIQWVAKCIALPLPHPHSLRWTSLGKYNTRLQFSDATVALLPLAVPMLTNLRENFDTITDFSFLHRLPRLQSLMMGLRLQRRALWPSALEALTNPPADAPFAQLTELSLRYVRRITVEDIEAVLRQVPRLTSLDLLGTDRAKSLRFLSSAPHLRSQLTFLGIEGDLLGWMVPVQDFFDYIVPSKG
jgi:hypothetical protein